MARVQATAASISAPASAIRGQLARSRVSRHAADHGEMWAQPRTMIARLSGDSTRRFASALAITAITAILVI